MSNVCSSLYPTDKLYVHKTITVYTRMCHYAETRIVWEVGNTQALIVLEGILVILKIFIRL